MHKLNTRNRGVYNGLPTSAVVTLTKKKKGYRYTGSEIEALREYYNERLANAGCSETAGTPEWLKYEGHGIVLSVVEAEYINKGEL